MTDWRDARAGAGDALPALPVNVPFGVVAGVAAVDAGFTGVEGVLLSALWFAGAAQLAAIDLLAANAPVAVVVATALVVNARYVMYSAAIAPHFRAFSRPVRWTCSFFLLDVTFALAAMSFDADADAAAAPDKLPYYLGAALPLWATWVGATALGVLVGAKIPPGWGFDFAVPLFFLGLLAPNVQGRASLTAAAVGGVGATVGVGVPFNLGLVVAALCGVVAGLFAEEYGGGARE